MRSSKRMVAFCVIVSLVVLSLLILRRGAYAEEELSPEAIAKYEEELQNIEEKRLKQYRFLARLYQMKEDFPKAVEMYEKILELKPEEERNLYPTLASLYERAKMYDKAAEAYGKLIKMYLGNFRYNLALAAVYEKMGKDKEAELEYKKIMDEAKDQWAIDRAQTKLFELYRRQNKLGEVAAEYEKVLSKMEKESLKLYKSLGDTYRKEENYPKAIEMYKKASGLVPTDVGLRFSLADLYKEARMFKQAINEYEKVLKMNPGDKVKARVKKAIEEIKSIEE